MTFSDLVTVMGAAAGTATLLAPAAAPLLAELDPVPRRRAAAGVPAPRRPDPAETVAPAPAQAPASLP